MQHVPLLKQSLRVVDEVKASLDSMPPLRSPGELASVGLLGNAAVTRGFPDLQERLQAARAKAFTKERRIAISQASRASALLGTLVPRVQSMQVEAGQEPPVAQCRVTPTAPLSTTAVLCAAEDAQRAAGYFTASAFCAAKGQRAAPATRAFTEALQEQAGAHLAGTSATSPRRASPRTPGPHAASPQPRGGRDTPPSSARGKKKKKHKHKR